MTGLLTRGAQRLARGLAIVPVVLPALAQASQGPGTAAGTASPWLQAAMAVALYGGAGLMIVAALIRALRQAR